MSRLKAYLHVATLQLGLAYIALWAITFVALDYGPHIFGGVCRPVGSQLLFYWMCDSASPLAFVAALANTALSVTVWAPVYVAAATVQPGAIVLAVPILLVHLIGLPAALLVSIRSLARIVQLPRWLTKRRDSSDDEPASPPLRVLAPSQPAAPKIKARTTFGLRDHKR